MSIRLMTGCLLLVLAAFAAQAANPVVIQPDGRRVEGTEVRATREGVIYLTTAGGRLEFPKGTRVLIDQPAELAKAEEQVKKGLFAEAAPVLDKLVEELRFLGWDVKARSLQAQTYLGRGEAKKAVEAFEALMAEFKETQSDDAVRAGYLRALAAAGETEKVAPLLETAIKTGPRGEAAQAQLIRGKARLAANDIEGALYDFMRNARFFKEYKEEAAESAFLAGECLEKLGDRERALVFFRQAAQEFPESGWAARAKARTGQP